MATNSVRNYATGNMTPSEVPAINRTNERCLDSEGAIQKGKISNGRVRLVTV